MSRIRNSADPSTASRGNLLREADASAYHGEWYLPDAAPEEYEDFRTREKGYSMSSMILILLIGFIPAMGLSTPYAAACYILTAVLSIWQTVTAYRGPSSRFPLTRRQYEVFAKRPRILSAVLRILVMLGLIFDVIGTYQLGFDISIWTVLQLILYLLSGLTLQFLYRRQRGLSFESFTQKPET